MNVVMFAFVALLICAFTFWVIRQRTPPGRARRIKTSIAAVIMVGLVAFLA